MAKTPIVNHLAEYSESEVKQITETIATAYGILKKPYPKKKANQLRVANTILSQYVESNIPTGEADQYGRIPIRKVNIYTDGLNSHLITVDVHKGKTPLTLRHPIDGKVIKSLCYLVPQSLSVMPIAEWYMPTPATISTMTPQLIRHCLDGGLILQRVGAKNESQTKNSIKAMSNNKHRANVLKIEVFQFLRNQGAEFDEDNLNELFHDFSDKSFVSFNFHINQKSILIVSSNFCNPEKEINNVLLENKGITNLSDFKALYKSIEAIRLEKEIE